MVCGYFVIIKCSVYLSYRQGAENKVCFVSVKKDNLRSTEVTLTTTAGITAKTGIIAGIAVALVAAIVVGIIYLRRRKTRKRGTFMRKRYE